VRVLNPHLRLLTHAGRLLFISLDLGNDSDEGAFGHQCGQVGVSPFAVRKREGNGFLHFAIDARFLENITDGGVFVNGELIDVTAHFYDLNIDERHNQILLLFFTDVVLGITTGTTSPLWLSVITMLPNITSLSVISFTWEKLTVGVVRMGVAE
jgi:hypothetical protein